MRSCPPTHLPLQKNNSNLNPGSLGPLPRCCGFLKPGYLSPSQLLPRVTFLSPHLWTCHFPLSASRETPSRISCGILLSDSAQQKQLPGELIFGGTSPTCVAPGPAEGGGYSLPVKASRSEYSRSDTRSYCRAPSVSPNVSHAH